MRALTIIPGQAGSIRLAEVAEPPLSNGSMLVETIAVGVCGTDLDEVTGKYGWPPPGRERLIIGHESLGRVLEAPAGSRFSPGDLVVGIVRKPDPVPCSNCAVNEWDMCLNGQYTERGIKELDGFCSERFRIEPEFAIKIDPRLGLLGVLTEPASVLAKAWEQIERIGRRAHWEPRRLLVTGAGPIGLLGALMGGQRGLDVTVLDRVTTGPKPDLVRDLGATYHVGEVQEIARTADIVLECTGVGKLVFDILEVIPACSIVCLTGLAARKRVVPVDVAAIEKMLVLENAVIVGSVNANRRHYEQAAAILLQADSKWLHRLITRKVPLDHWADAYERRADDVKPVVLFQ